jgi:hypothetical protein
MPRMKILNSVEREAFELPPMFNSAARSARPPALIIVSANETAEGTADFH